MQFLRDERKAIEFRRLVPRPSPSTLHPSHTVYQSIADTIVQLCAFQASVLMTRIARIQSEYAQPGKLKGKEHEKTNGAVLFLAEVELMRRGAIVEKKANPQPSSVVDDRLITGQNPAPSTVAAQNVINLIAATKAA